MKWLIGAGFSISAFPLRFVALDFSLFAAHPHCVTDWSPFPEEESHLAMHRGRMRIPGTA